MTAAALARPELLVEDLDEWDLAEIEWHEARAHQMALARSLAHLRLATRMMKVRRKAHDDALDRLAVAIDDAVAADAALHEAIGLVELACRAVAARHSR